MKKLIILATFGITLLGAGNSYAEEKVVGLYPSPEGDYQKLKTESLQVTGGAPQAGSVLTAVDNQGTARWAQSSSSLTAGNTGYADWDYGIKVGGKNPDYWGAVSMTCGSTTGTGKCVAHSTRGALLSCSDGRSMLTLLKNTTGNGEWMTWHYRSYCVAE